MLLRLTLSCVSLTYLCQFLLVCFKVCMSETSDKTGKFLVNYSNLFWGPHFIRTQCTSWFHWLIALICVRRADGSMLLRSTHKHVSWSADWSDMYSPAVLCYYWSSVGKSVWGMSTSASAVSAWIHLQWHWQQMCWSVFHLLLLTL